MYFDNSSFKELTIKNVIFNNKTSFANCTFQKIQFSQLVFEKPAFFDDLKILDLGQCDKRTLRSIKRELQKTDNRIDYNRFKAYELDAHKIELPKKQWSDRFILWLNSVSSGHGMNWFKGICFTIIVAFVFYTLYFSSEHYQNNFEISISALNRFFKGYFDYLIPSYSSPFSYGLAQWYQYIPFILGKVFFAYGIYQTIQSFRKFRF